MSVEGSYDCILKTPRGDQKSVLVVNVSGDTWTGTNTSEQGTLECKDGKVDGDTITWTMDITSPMSLKLTGTATIEGDDLTGSVKAGFLGSMPLSGTRIR